MAAFATWRFPLAGLHCFHSNGDTTLVARAVDLVGVDEEFDEDEVFECCALVLSLLRLLLELGRGVL